MKGRDPNNPFWEFHIFKQTRGNPKRKNGFLWISHSFATIHGHGTLPPVLQSIALATARCATAARRSWQGASRAKMEIHAAVAKRTWHFQVWSKDPCIFVLSWFQGASTWYCRLFHQQLSLQLESVRLVFDTRRISGRYDPSFDQWGRVAHILRRVVGPHHLVGPI